MLIYKRKQKLMTEQQAQEMMQRIKERNTQLIVQLWKEKLLSRPIYEYTMFM
mgnify:CR=1 FL=1